MTNKTSNFIEQFFKISFRNFGRSYGGYEEITDKEDLTTWKAASLLLSHKIYNFQEDVIEINIDWGDAIRYCSYWHGITSSQDKLVEFIENVNKGVFEITEPVIVKAVVKLRSKDDKDERLLKKTCLDYLIFFLHEIYLKMNLAAPGSCNLTSIISTIDNSKPVEIILNSIFFEDAWIESMQNGWPKVDFLNLEQVCKWINGIDLNNREIAEERIHKALFAVLHIAKQFSIEPTFLIWFSHIFESIYDTPPALSRFFLKQRISELLKPPDKNKSWLKKGLNSFYDDRNAFAHGGMKILHPSPLFLDQHIFDEHWSKLSESINFASCIVVATLQEFVKRRWKEIFYKEKQFGVVIEGH